MPFIKKKIHLELLFFSGLQYCSPEKNSSSRLSRSVSEFKCLKSDTSTFPNYNFPYYNIRKGMRDTDLSLNFRNLFGHFPRTFWKFKPFGLLMESHLSSMPEHETKSSQARNATKTRLRKCAVDYCAAERALSKLAKEAESGGGGQEGRAADPAQPAQGEQTHSKLRLMRALLQMWQGARAERGTQVAQLDQVRRCQGPSDRCQGRRGEQENRS
jgi:hypothetical protein